MCACGKPLHYTDPEVQALVQQLVGELGENVKIVVGARAWMVSRHFIALHGIKAAELPTMGFVEVTDGAV